MNLKSQTFASYLLNRADHITDKWLSPQSKEANFPIFFTDSNRGEVKSLLRQLLQVIAARLDDHPQPSKKNWSEKAGENAAEMGIPIKDTLKQFKQLRRVLLTYLEEFLDEQQEEHTPKSTLKLGQRINEEIDLMIEQFTQAYFQYTTDRMKLQQEVISELSTPIISITDGISVLPLIGDIDAHRVVKIIQEVLHESGKRESDCLIIDISGILIMDKMIAFELSKLITALNMTGIEVSLTGMRPEMAHVLVNSGLKFEQMNMYQNLELALKDFGIVRN